MAQDKKQSASFFTKFFQHRVAAFGTVFVGTSVGLIIGLLFFPSVRTILNDSALATGLFPGKAITAEPLPATMIFKDVSSNHPNAAAIKYLKDHHILNGYPDGTFKPDSFVSRGELLKLLFDAQKISPTAVIYHTCFRDVKDEWFATYVCYAEAEGLVQGYKDKTFHPGDSVTVAEALKILLTEYRVKLLQSSSVPGMNLDPKAWFTPYIWTALSKNLITWNTEVTPVQVPNLTDSAAANAFLKRSQFAEILYRLMK